MCPLSLFLGYRFTDFYSGFSPDQVRGGKRVKNLLRCAQHSFYVTQSFSSCHAALKIFVMSNMFKFCMHPTTWSIHRLIDDFEEQFEAKYPLFKFCMKHTITKNISH